MRALEIITGHVIYNRAYTYKFQLKTTKVEWTYGVHPVARNFLHLGAKTITKHGEMRTFSSNWVYTVSSFTLVTDLWCGLQIENVLLQEWMKVSEYLICLVKNNIELIKTCTNLLGF